MTISRMPPAPARRAPHRRSWPMSLGLVIRSGAGEVKRVTAGSVLIAVDDGQSLEHFLLSQAEFERWLEARVAQPLPDLAHDQS